MYFDLKSIVSRSVSSIAVGQRNLQMGNATNLNILVKVHAATGCWEQAQSVLQPAVDKAQDAVEADIEEEESEFTGALEAVLFQLVALSMQAAWHLQHSGIAEEMHTLCVHIAESSREEDRPARIQHLVQMQLKYVAQVLDGQCDVPRLQQAWSLLQQTVTLIDHDMTAEACPNKWIDAARTDVRLCNTPLL